MVECDVFLLEMALKLSLVSCFAELFLILCRLIFFNLCCTYFRQIISRNRWTSCQKQEGCSALEAQSTSRTQLCSFSIIYFLFSCFNFYLMP
jgi:hypothetical protein